MNAQLNQILTQQRNAELQRAAEQTRIASELPRTRSRAARAPRHTEEPRVAGFTLRGHHLAKLDRFLWQAKSAARRAEREFEGVSVEIDARGEVTVHAPGMTSMVL